MEIRPAVGLDVSYKKKGRVRNCSKVFGLRNRKDGRASTEMRKTSEIHHLKMLFHCLLFSKISDEKSAVFQIIVPLNVRRKSPPRDGKAAYHLKPGL